MTLSSKLTRPLKLAVAALMAVALVACATVPYTGRTSLNLLPDEMLLSMSLQQYSQVLKKSKLSQDKAKVAMIRRVGRRIARAAEDFLRETGRGGDIKNYRWEFNLIDDDKVVNAWAMPGGKVAFYTGILPLTKDDNGVAVVMGHEVAHALAKHGNERMSHQLLVAMGGLALAVALHDKPRETRNIFLAVYGVGAAVGFTLPYSRLHESEADRIGLMLMARAGYDPRVAPAFWERMAKKGGPRPPEFLSTHPAPESRINTIRSLIPEAMRYYRPRG